MKSKILLGSIIGLPIVGVGLIGNIGAAEAVTLTPGSQLNLTGDFRAPGLDEGVEGDRFTGRLLFGPEMSDFSRFAEVGEYAFATIGAISNSGSFDGYDVPNPGAGGFRYEGSIQSFGPSDPVPEIPFILLPETAPADAPPVPASTFNLLTFVVQEVNPTAFEASGTGFFTSEGDRTPGSFQFTGQGLDLDENDFNGSYSATLTVEAEPTEIPEPSSTLGLLVLGALGGASLLKQRQQKQKMRTRHLGEPQVLDMPVES